MNILIANVGNIRSNEIKVLAETLNKKHKVTIASMAIDSSCKGQAFSLSTTPVRVNAVDFYAGIPAYEFYSTPADAVSIMLGEIMTRRPDLVICGLNNGTHMGQDIYCSSNIGMAMEASFFGVPSIAVALERQIGGNSISSCAIATKFIEKNLDTIANLDLPKHTFLSISIPKVESYSQLRAPKITRLGSLAIINKFEERLDPLNGKYYWAKFEPRVAEKIGAYSGAVQSSVQHANERKKRGRAYRGLGDFTPENAHASEYETDIEVFNDGHISITPISYDATCPETLEMLPVKLTQMILRTDL